MDSIYKMMVGRNIGRFNPHQDRIMKGGETDPVESQKMFDTMSNAQEENPQPQVAERGDDDPYEYISVGALGGGQKTGFDREHFIAPRNYRGRGKNWSASFDEPLDGQDQLGLPAHGLYASKRNSHNSSHWADVWKDIKREAGSPSYNGFSFNASPTANIHQIDSFQDFKNLIMKYPFARVGGKEYRSIPEIEEYLKTYRKEHPEMGERALGDMTRAVSIDWEKLYERSAQDGNPIHGVYFSQPFSRWYNNVKSGPNMLRTPATERGNRGGSGISGIFAGLGGRMEGDHLVIVHPDGIGDNKFYDYEKTARPNRQDRTYQTREEKEKGKSVRPDQIIPPDWLD